MHPQSSICEQCGAPFTPKVGHAGRFCAIGCWYAYRREQAYAESPETRFWAKVDRSAGPDGCWRRDGAYSAGYAQFCLSRGVWVKGHTFAYLTTYGHLPPGKPFVLHKCPGGGNRWCVNPAHLAAGTGAENAADRKRDGQQRNGDHRGERNGKAKLTASDVLAIRLALAHGGSQYALARAYGVTQVTISAIMLGKTWQHTAVAAPLPARWHVKLTPAQSQAIRDALDAGVRGVDLARVYGVSRSTISMIRSGKRWGVMAADALPESEKQ